MVLVTLLLATVVQASMEKDIEENTPAWNRSSVFAHQHDVRCKAPSTSLPDCDLITSCVQSMVLFDFFPVVLF